ncbi:MAG: NINE protein [Candidatus Howiella sp.]|jgi:TM2 domain-containing membrane protein YozV
MYCKNCGNQMDDVAAVCVKCGAAKGSGTNFCANCGQPENPGAAFCVNCGAPSSVGTPVPAGAQKSKLAAGLLGIFLGSLGIHNFYLGYQKKALIQLLVSLIGGILTCGVAAVAMEIWGLVERIQILTGSINVDANGVPLKD